MLEYFQSEMEKPEYGTLAHLKSHVLQTLDNRNNEVKQTYFVEIAEK
jgi:hypothetical protein